MVKLDFSKSIHDLGFDLLTAWCKMMIEQWDGKAEYNLNWIGGWCCEVRIETLSSEQIFHGYMYVSDQGTSLISVDGFVELTEYEIGWDFLKTIC